MVTHRCLFLFVVGSICFIFADGNPCSESGWIYKESTKMCYKIYPHKAPWNYAETICVAQGGHQPTIRDLKENMVVAELIKDVGIVWLAAAQFGASRSYMWSDQTPVYFEHWKNGSRPAFNRGKKCIKMEGDSGEWVQSCCRVSAAYICQKPVATLEDNNLNLN